MKIIGVVPARYGSIRFPGKPLAKILGKPMVQWVLEGALGSSLLDDLVLATDHEAIAEVGHNVGVRVVLTPTDLSSGTDRVYVALKENPPDLVVNIQGDEPMVHGSHIDTVIRTLMKDPKAHMATLAYETSDPQSPDRVKIVTDLQGFALYFSRAPIPYVRVPDPSPKYLIHLGLYGYRWAVLEQFVHTDPTPLEKIEGLEQLRALQLQFKIKVAVVQEVTVPVDRPEDLQRVEQLIRLRSR